MSSTSRRQHSLLLTRDLRFAGRDLRLDGPESAASAADRVSAAARGPRTRTEGPDSLPVSNAVDTADSQPAGRAVRDVRRSLPGRWAPRPRPRRRHRTDSWNSTVEVDTGPAAIGDPGFRLPHEARVGGAPRRGPARSSGPGAPNSRRTGRSGVSPHRRRSTATRRASTIRGTDPGCSRGCRAGAWLPRRSQSCFLPDPRRERSPDQRTAKP